MNARFIIVAGTLAKDPAQMSLTERDHVVNALRSVIADRNGRVIADPINTPVFFGADD
jgi:hypothetical protein